MGSIEKKYSKLKSILSEMESVLVAYSGGTDSTFLLKTAQDVLGDRVIAAIAESPTFPASEKDRALSEAKKMNVEVIVFKSTEIRNKRYLQNKPDRCYWCKKELFTGFKKEAHKKGISCIVEGSNFDDRKDYRPGFKAVTELGIKSPLYEAKLIKADIRELSRKAGLDTWNRPASACLASRIPYGKPINEKTLKQIDRAEQYLKKLGINQVRVRHHGDTARIETLNEFFTLLFRDDVRKKTIRAFKRIGYLYITVDLEGYSMGSLNKVLSVKV